MTPRVLRDDAPPTTPYERLAEVRRWTVMLLDGNCAGTVTGIHKGLGTAWGCIGREVPTVTEVERALLVLTDTGLVVTEERDGATWYRVPEKKPRRRR